MRRGRERESVAAQTSRRKIEQLRICLEEEVERRKRSFDEVFLVHNALPEVSIAEIETHVEFLSHSLDAPLMIASMTGGHPETKVLNRIFASVAEREGIGIGVGSQRAALEDEKNEESFSIVREYAPHAFVYANIGVVQLRDMGVEAAERAIEMVDANAIAIHLNFFQEAIQPEGDSDARGCLAAIEEACRSLKVPVIAKETGAGISRSVALRLLAAGVSALDVGGNDGTNLAVAEIHRAKAENNSMLEHIGNTFGWEWGISTVESILECASLPVEVVATGGIRSGLDVAKSIALGADLCSAALPFLKAAVEGLTQKQARTASVADIRFSAAKEESIERAVERVCERVREMKAELKIAMFLTGCSSVERLKSADVVLTGRTREIAEQRGFLSTLQRKRKRCEAKEESEETL